MAKGYRWVVRQFTPAEQWARFAWLGKRLAPLGRRLLPAVLALVAVHAVATFVLGRQVEQRIATLKAQGKPVSLADLEQPPVPDKDNAAVVIEAGLRRLDLAEFERDGRLLRDHRQAMDAGGAPPAPDAVEAMDARYRWVFEVLEQAASRPHCRFPRDTERDWQRSAHNLAGRARGRLASLALLHARLARTGEALSQLELDLRLGRTLSDDLNWFSYLETHQGGWVADLLWEVARHVRVNEGAARRMAQLLVALDARKATVRRLETERASGIETYERLHAGGWRNAPGWLLDAGPASMPGQLWHSVVSRCVGGYAWRPLLYADELAFLSYCEQWIRILQAPGSEAAATIERLGFRAQIGNPWYAVVSWRVRPHVQNETGFRFRAEVANAGSQAFLGVLAYRDRFGSYPPSLQDVRTRLAWSVPTDPMTGRDFGYRREGQGFVLYSAGDNRRDDGGRNDYLHLRPRYRKGLPSPPMAHPGGMVGGRGDKPDDIIWRLER